MEVYEGWKGSVVVKYAAEEEGARESTFGISAS